MYYLIYEITNLINGKNYIGQHITENVNDGYMGGGVAIRSAIKKYGVKNFKKEILLYAKNEAALNFFEKCLVTPEFIELKTNYNLKEGGGSCGKFSEEARKKMSLSRMGRKMSSETIKKRQETKRLWGTTTKGRKMPPKNPESIKKMLETKMLRGTTRKGKKLSPEQIQKMSLANLGKKLNPETKLKISLAHKGKKLSSETKAKMSLAAKNRSPEHKAKICLAARNRSPEHIQKIALANRGKKLTPEHIQKRQETRRKNREAKLALQA